MAGGTPVNLGGSCVGNSCIGLSPCGYTQGAFAPGNQTFQIRLQYQDQSAPFALLNLSDSSQAPIGCGPCNLMLPLVTLVVPNAPGELAQRGGLEAARRDQVDGRMADRLLGAAAFGSGGSGHGRMIARN